MGGAIGGNIKKAGGAAGKRPASAPKIKLDDASESNAKSSAGGGGCCS
jgi:hypothetical protein